MNRWITRIGVVLGRLMHCMVRVSAQGLRMAAQAKAVDWVEGWPSFWQSFDQFPRFTLSRDRSNPRFSGRSLGKRRGIHPGTIRRGGMALSRFPRFARKTAPPPLGRENSRGAIEGCHGVRAARVDASGRCGFRVISRWFATVWPSHAGWPSQAREAKACVLRLWGDAPVVERIPQSDSASAPRFGTVGWV